ncbi:GNAT family N-acetyltransferase [Persicimonas caeni]|uniref:GNAT family N-acetyltransferase n=1 Tax=Persicimonas caeni TaxID=2292766 RepID=A0A4Y6PN62_PERCE|nr:GNAT family N-acetyltransferase [Persicimonas caeni]QDG49663.1 GNAT family N-acetyltransferase [Persicimonas caeni]QED30884.1 GNAT family N-acetyltransferase [Persicimonas caeni]
MSRAFDANRRDGIIVRTARASDAQEIAELDVRSWRAAYSDIFPASELEKLSVDERRSCWKRIIARNFGSQLAVVGELDGEIVGFCQAGPDRSRMEDAAEIYTLYVDPEHWGEGVGTALLDVVLPWLAPNYDTATLWVVRENALARRFYEARGFRWVEHSFKAFSFFDYLAQCVRYSKRLDAHFSYDWRQMYGA